MITAIAASEAKAKFSELLARTKAGEAFVVTLHGQEVARLIPANTPANADLQALIAEMENVQKRCVLNPPGKPRITVKELVEMGRR